MHYNFKFISLITLQLVIPVMLPYFDKLGVSFTILRGVLLRVDISLVCVFSEESGCVSLVQEQCRDGSLVPRAKMQLSVALKLSFFFYMSFLRWLLRFAIKPRFRNNLVLSTAGGCVNLEREPVNTC